VGSKASYLMGNGEPNYGRGSVIKQSSKGASLSGLGALVAKCIGWREKGNWKGENPIRGGGHPLNKHWQWYGHVCEDDSS